MPKAAPETKILQDFNEILKIESTKYEIKSMRITIENCPTSIPKLKANKGFAMFCPSP